MSERTTYTYKDGFARSGTWCDHCGTTYSQCTTDLLARRGACCAACCIRDTHDERIEAIPERPSERIRVHGWPYRPTMPEKR